MTHLVLRFATATLVILPILCWAEQKLSVEILEQQYHDPKTFTQGLYWNNGKLYESSGLYGKSFLVRYDADSNAIEKKTPISPRYFAEGLTLFNNELFLLTWRSKTLLVYDPENFRQKRKLGYAGEGWGLTHNADQLIMSNGTDTISFRDPITFKTQREVRVHNRWRKFHKINELEYANSSIWANVWQATYILEISPEDGRVKGIASLNEIVAENTPSAHRNVLNGIAYDEEKKAFWITGKFWKKRYLVRFKPQSS